MILQALTRYYDILANDDSIDIARLGYSAVPVSFAANLSREGELLDLIPQFDLVQRGKITKEVPRTMLLPERVKRSMNIAPNYLWDNPVYVLGLSQDSKTSTTYAKERFEAFRQLHQKRLATINSPAARAVVAFLNAHTPETNEENPQIARFLPELAKGGNLVFQVEGEWVHLDDAIRRAWEQQTGDDDAESMQCLITGEVGPIKRLHPSLKGVREARAGGASLISFNKDAFESYSRSQGANSPIGDYATFAYTTVLNYLLSDANPNRKFYMGDATVVYWAESKNRVFEEAYASFMEPPLVEIEPDAATTRSVRAEAALKKAGEKVRKAQALDVDALLAPLQDEDPRFFVLGLSPNSARVSVRFFIAEPFSQAIDNIMAHYRDLEIVKQFDSQPSYITIGQILTESVSKKARDKNASPLLAGALLRAVLANDAYPAALYYAILNRIRADMDDKSKQIEKINYTRAAIIKAYLARKFRNSIPNPFQEVLTVSLNEQSTSVPYLLGRLFAVLEMAQRQAIGANINATIKDRYFASACGSPRNVFPTLLRLSQHWISKSKKYYTDNEIQKILNLLEVDRNPFPARLSLDEQGIFVLGYYHERAALYTRASKPSDVAQDADIEAEAAEAADTTEEMFA